MSIAILLFKNKNNLHIWMRQQIENKCKYNFSVLYTNCQLSTKIVTSIRIGSSYQSFHCFWSTFDSTVTLSEVSGGKIFFKRFYNNKLMWKSYMYILVIKIIINILTANANWSASVRSCFSSKAILNSVYWEKFKPIILAMSSHGGKMFIFIQIVCCSKMEILRN